MKITLTTTFEIITTYEAENYLEAVKMNSLWLKEEYGDLEEYKTNIWGNIAEEITV
jgi:hypothetical protein